MRCDCGAKMVRRWTRRTTGKADRDRGTGATEPRRRRAAMTARGVEPPSGEVAEVDFGLFGLWPDPTTGYRARSADSSSPSAIAAYAFLWLCLRQQRLEQVGFEETATFEQIVWDSPVSFDRGRVREPFSPHWLASSRTSSSAVPSAWGRPSSPAPSGTVPDAPATASAALPSPSSCRGSISPGPITPSSGNCAELARAGPAPPRRLRPAQAHRPAVERFLQRFLRCAHRAPSAGRHDHHE